MSSTGIRRIRSSSADRRWTSGSSDHHHNNNNNDVRVLPPDVAAAPQRKYNVDDVTSLEKHRRIFSMERELQHWREQAVLAMQDASYREQELLRRRSEHAVVRQDLERVVRELVEKQKGLTAELQQCRQEVQFLRDDAAAKDAEITTAHATQQQLQQEVEASQRREAETTSELSIVVDKLAKADTYIQTLSDEAVARQLEIEQLRAQLSARAEAAAGAKEAVRKRQAAKGMWSQLTEAAMACADRCDEMSRECEELIDVVREEQKHNSQHDPLVASGGADAFLLDGSAKKDRSQQQQQPKEKQRSHVGFISCKPSGEELERLLRTALTSRQRQQQDRCSSGRSSSLDRHVDEDDSGAWEGTALVVGELLRGMRRALLSARDDVLVAGRAY
ncbi:hypothetical protein DQ04_01561110, partial [Trypanosoma grayi]|uniref:hypothetical protein n=1 Tax=Trypanosoma grayi TaxID=71804 RepID=UPI0004F42AD7